MKVLFVLTSHGELGATGKKTGFWVEEFAAPYYVLADAGVEVTLASPAGGTPPIDPSSQAPGAATEATKRFDEDKALQERLRNTKKLSEVKAEDYDGVFYPGGHGPLWDLTNDNDSIRLIEDFAKQNKPIAAVCHAPAVFADVKAPNGEPLVKGKKVTGFTNTEEEAVDLTEVVPFLVQEKLIALGGEYSHVADWHPHVVRDGMLITGQNPASSEGAAKELLSLLQK
ncbi:putative intracellular protease/amidase [Pontibacter ummariensis]|uniref:Putative intracellular protease/amidase n=1 Tax=Pontibacter ummariensis TaxID=1610492 RepID=A0A239C4D8_9BACT|nr:type 1 glutamine amidotransferase domain-containing protein [Pontibacter ummariensis]PRY15489.1 putative intracellular protease/amidase [Pontibacter ummariensis]SNS14284.1 Putative intracellular protease/amidase [Pontibacter ummariensis]